MPADTGIVPRVAVGGGPPLPFWRADSVRQRYLPGTNVLVTVARFGAARVRIECAAAATRSAAIESGSCVRTRSGSRTTCPRGCTSTTRQRRGSSAHGRRGSQWLARARPLGPGRRAWARRMYERSLLVLRALTDRRTGAVAAGARDGWAYVWPRDAAAVAIALAAAGHRAEARRVVALPPAASTSTPRPASTAPAPRSPAARPQGDAAGWVAAAARAAGTAARRRRRSPGASRADYQEKAPGDYLGNALASAGGPETPPYSGKSARRRVLWRVRDRGGWCGRRATPASGLDSAAAWAVRPFPQPALFPAARRTLLRLAAESGPLRDRPLARTGRDDDPWTAPTAWSAWSLAALGERRSRRCG